MAFPGAIGMTHGFLTLDIASFSVPDMSHVARNAPRSPKNAAPRSRGGQTPSVTWRREGWLFILAALAVYLLIALVGFRSQDPSWFSSGQGGPVHNWGGLVGAYLSDFLVQTFGIMAWLLPFGVATLAWQLWRHWFRALPLGPGRYLGASFLALGIMGIMAMLSPAPWWSIPGQGPGGIIGMEEMHLVLGLIGEGGSLLFFLAALLLGAFLLTGLGPGAFYQRCRDAWRGLPGLPRLHVGRTPASAPVQGAPQPAAQAATRSTASAGPAAPPMRRKARADLVQQLPLADAQGHALADGLPPLALLDAPDADDPRTQPQPEELEQRSRLLEEKLADFGVSARVVAAHPGPVITRFEIEPAAGVKVSQIAGLTKDLARTLSATRVRVVETIPGKPTMGIEIPNSQRRMVRLSEVLSSAGFGRSHSLLTLALGKDIGGQPVSADLAKMPHLLVAGTTGAGKSVGVNAMILSILFKATPAEVRLIMVDPKMLELSIYEGIPHLLAPVVTDMKEAANALRWCVAEMERRYQLMARAGVRNLAGFNQKLVEAAARGEPLMGQEAGFDGQPRPLEAMSSIVVVIDEFADLMMVVGKQVESLITRLAQKARAAGLHLIMATQRPSVDVITGLIKANIPTRIAFQVSSRIDSRTILDQAGAETLLGQGDMLYLPPGTGYPVRVHGAFVGDDEVHRVVAYLRQHGIPQYDESILQGADAGDGEGGGEGGGSEADPLYDQAVAIVTGSRKASISYVQRQLKVGYNRAARMIEEMERVGIVGPLQSNGSREVHAAAPPAND